MDLSVIPVALYLSIFFPFLIIIILLPLYITISVLHVEKKSADSKEEDN